MSTRTDEAIVVELSELKSGRPEKTRGRDVALGADTLGEKWAAIVTRQGGRWRCGIESACYFFEVDHSPCSRWVL